MRWAARRTLVGRARASDDPEEGRFTRREVDRLLDAAWREFDRLAPEAPSEPTVGARMNVLLACLTYSFFEMLLAAGVERSYAVELVSETAWRIYEKWGLAARSAARGRGRDPLARMRGSVEAFLRFPFNEPGYGLRRVEDRDAVAFDILRCPVAEYFAKHDAQDLCVSAWCNQDYALAELWGGRLRRTGTLAGGSARCDFRFEVTSGSD
jgi:ubiquinone biosynthesis protein